MSVREQFEAAVLNEYPNQNMGKFATGEYQSTTIEHCWWAWQASRAAVVVNLPKTIHAGGPDDDIYWPQDVRAAIEAAGVKVAP